jgi:hypothetical protein
MKKPKLLSLFLFYCWLTTLASLANAANKKPIADAGADQRIGFAVPVTLNGNKSHDTDGTITSYHWQQIKGRKVLLGGNQKPLLTFKAPVKTKDQLALTLVFKLTVTDNQHASATDTVVAHIIPYKINNTGISRCGNATKNNLTCPVTGFPGQDAEFSSDINNNTGQIHFSYTKLDKHGKELPKNAKTWACARDNVTGLIWEVKTDDGGLHHKDWSYYWSDESDISGVEKKFCGGFIYCHSQAYIDAVNTEHWCGSTNWRLPSRHELISLANLSKIGLVVDRNYFPNTLASTYWTSSLQVDGHAVEIDFSTGDIGWVRIGGNARNPVMLVRDGN